MRPPLLPPGYRRACAAACLLGALSLGAHAGELDMAGEASLGLWSSNRLLDDAQGIATARLRLELDWSPSDALQIRADTLWLSAPERLDGRREDAQLTELYLRARHLPCAPALGKRLVLWGRADAFNPTDQVSPIQFRRMTPRVAEQRDGRWGLHLDCLVGDGSLQVHVLEGFEFNAIPFDATIPVALGNTSAEADTSIAIRYDRLGASIDWSVTAINGHDLFPTLELDPHAMPFPTVDLVPTRMRLFGGDAAMARGSWVFRGELARTVLDAGDSPYRAIRHSHTSGVVGAERALGDRETIAVQAFWKRLDAVPAPTGLPLQDALQDAQGLISNEVERHQHGLTLRYATPLFESRADADILAIWGVPGNDWLLRGRLRYALNDRVRFSTGFDVYRGPADSYLGNLRSNSLAFVELDFLW